MLNKYGDLNRIYKERNERGMKINFDQKYKVYKKRIEIENVFTKAKKWPANQTLFFPKYDKKKYRDWSYIYWNKSVLGMTLN